MPDWEVSRLNERISRRGTLVPVGLLIEGIGDDVEMHRQREKFGRTHALGPRE